MRTPPRTLSASSPLVASACVVLSSCWAAACGSPAQPPVTAPAASASAAGAPAAPTCDCPHCRGKHQGGAGHGHHGPGHEGCKHGAGHGAHGDGPPHGEGPHAGGPPDGHGPHPGGPHAAHGHDQGPHHDFSDAERWAKVFDDPARDAWQKPDEVVRWLALAPTDLVVDLGAGTGYFTMRLARAVPKGKVVALDVEANMVKFVEARAAKEKLTNVVARVTPTDRAAIEERPNLVLIVNTYHHLTDRQPYLREVAKTLAPKGRIVVVDFRKGDLPVGPPDAHKIAPEAVTAEMKAAGLTFCGALDTLPHQYVLAYALTCK